jgi:CheY-like chemotaxis protein
VRILYLEDSDFDIDFIRRYVKSAGNYEFVSTKRASEALLQLQTQKTDIFFVDIMINGEPVYDIIQTAIEHGLARHIIPMTARALPSEVAQYQSMGCSHVIAKPFTVNVLDAIFAQLG